MSSVIIREVEDLDIFIEEAIEFDQNKINEYLEEFNKKVDLGVFRSNASFYDSEWMTMIGGVEKPIVFPGEIEMKKLSSLFDRGMREFELAYRSFILFSLATPIITMGFNLAMKRLAKNFNTSSISRAEKPSIAKFIGYIRISEEKSLLFQELFDELEFREGGERILPEFEEIFQFSDIINNIVENNDLLKYKNYLLTIMWWKICSILPLRPSEFVRTKFNCVYKENNEFYLKVRRSKGKTGRRIKNISSADEYYSEDIVNIDKQIFYLILKYQKILMNEFNYIEQIELFPAVILGDTINGNRKKNINIVSAYDLLENLKKFYKNIVAKEYGLNPISKYLKREKNINYIGELTPYDARHIAIINLVLMGTDVLEVMHLAGHTNVNTAYGYFNHIKEFSKGYALGYAKSIANTKLKKETINTTNQAMKKRNQCKGNEDFHRILNTIKGKEIKPKKVEGGYCHYQNIDNDKSHCFFYERNHILCQFFVRDNIKVIEKEIKRVEDDIDATVKVLMDLIKDMDGISKFNELYQTTSYRLTNNISKLANLNKKYIMEE